MSPTHEDIDAKVIAALKKCNGSWLQKTIVGTLMANIGVLIYVAGTLWLDHVKLQETVIDVKNIKHDLLCVDRVVVETKTIVNQHENRIVRLESKSHEPLRSNIQEAYGQK